jgi:16S rRNA G1207 methylase RsmC
MPRLEVVPRPTPAERYDAAVEVEVDEALTVHAATIEDWVAPRQTWEQVLREGTDFDRPNNVEALLMYVAGEQTSSLAFRLDQLDSVTDTGQELVLVFEERDGIAKAARLTANGIDVELFHILTYT